MYESRPKCRFSYQLPAPLVIIAERANSLETHCNNFHSRKLYKRDEEVVTDIVARVDKRMAKTSKVFEILIINGNLFNG